MLMTAVFYLLILAVLAFWGLVFHGDGDGARLAP